MKIYLICLSLLNSDDLLSWRLRPPASMLTSTPPAAGWKFLKASSLFSHPVYVGEWRSLIAHAISCRSTDGC